MNSKTKMIAIIVGVIMVAGGIGAVLLSSTGNNSQDGVPGGSKPSTSSVWNDSNKHEIVETRKNGEVRLTVWDGKLLDKNTPHPSDSKTKKHEVSVSSYEPGKYVFTPFYFEIVNTSNEPKKLFLGAEHVGTGTTLYIVEVGESSDYITSTKRGMEIHMDDKKEYQPGESIAMFGYLVSPIENFGGHYRDTLRFSDTSVSIGETVDQGNYSIRFHK